MFTPVESIVGAILIQIATTSYISLMGGIVGFSSFLHALIMKLTLKTTALALGLADQ